MLDDCAGKSVEAVKLVMPNNKKEKECFIAPLKLLFLAITHKKRVIILAISR